MTRRRVALVAFPPDYFWPFSQALEAAGFEVYWISFLRSHARDLFERFKVPPDRILDVQATYVDHAADPAAARAALAALETGDGPRVNDIILMDRILRHRPERAALGFLNHVRQSVADFLVRREIALVYSGRDTAPQMVVMLTCRRLGVSWIVPTRPRIPREWYGFCQGHQFVDFVPFRAVTADDREWAAQALRDFRSQRMKRPELKRAARGFVDVMRLLPAHIAAFALELDKSRVDRGNRNTRYTLPALIKMYVRRRRNLLMYKLFPPYASPGTRPFCLYALHTQPESSIDVAGSYFSDQVGLIAFIARSMPSTHDLYVKVHPTDVDGQPRSFYTRIASIPGVRLINYDVDSRDLLQRASLVLSLTGTIAYESGLMGRPVITFAKVYFNDLPTVRYCDAPPQLPAIIRELLDTPPPLDLDERLVAFLADVRTRCFPGEVNRMYGDRPSPLSPDDLHTLQVAFERLYERLVLGRPVAPESEVRT